MSGERLYLIVSTTTSDDGYKRTDTRSDVFHSKEAADRRVAELRSYEKTNPTPGYRHTFRVKAVSTKSREANVKLQRQEERYAGQRF
jgi:hypothetical protein